MHQNEELTDRLKNTLVELTNLSELHEKIKEEKDLEIKVEYKISILLFFSFSARSERPKRRIPFKYLILYVQNLTESCTELQGQLVLIEHEGAKEMEELEKQMMEIAKYDDVLEVIKKYFDGE